MGGKNFWELLFAQRGWLFLAAARRWRRGGCTCAADEEECLFFGGRGGGCLFVGWFLCNLENWRGKNVILKLWFGDVEYSDGYKGCFMCMFSRIFLEKFDIRAQCGRTLFSRACLFAFNQQMDF